MYFWRPKLIDALHDLCASTKNILLLGDFNLAIDWSVPAESFPRTLRYLQFFQGLLLEQHVRHPTRGSSILDFILTSERIVHNVTVLPPLGNADHATLLFDLLMPVECPRVETYPDFAHGNFDAISAELSTINWWSFLDCISCIDELYHRFTSDCVHVFRVLSLRSWRKTYCVVSRDILSNSLKIVIDFLHS